MPISTNAPSVEDARIAEIARHIELVTRMRRIDPEGARSAMRAVVAAAPEMSFSQACSETALRLRADAEDRPRPAEAGGGAGDLRLAVAVQLDLLARTYPETERLRLRFRFETVDPDRRFGRARLDLMALAFERIFADAAGRVRAGFDVEALDRLAGVLRSPLPGDFFALLSTDLAMAGVAVCAYSSVVGEDASPRLEPLLRQHHPQAAAQARDEISRALTLAGDLRPGPAPGLG